MERPHYLIALLITVLLIAPLLPKAQSSNREAIYSAYINGRMDLWKGVTDRLEREQPRQADQLLELINYQYGYIAWCLGNKRNSEAREYLHKAEANLDRLEKINPNSAELFGYKAAFVGYRIGLNPVKAPLIGHRSTDFANKAIALDPNCPLGYIQLANSQYYRPAAVGGSKTNGIANYRKALKIMERNLDFLTKNWLYLNLLLTLAQACEETGKAEEAIGFYQRILQEEPGFLWVKNQLYPQLLQKQQQ